MLNQKNEGTPTNTPVKRKVSKSDNETLSGMVMYNGAMLDIDSLLERLSKGEKSMAETERLVQQVENERGKFYMCFMMYEVNTMLSNDAYTFSA
jgi:peroxiredoxin family protein